MSDLIETLLQLRIGFSLTHSLITSLIDKVIFQIKIGFLFTHLQPRGLKRQLSYYVLVHAGSFRVSVIHQTDIFWTTWSLSCVCDHSCACVYTRGLGTPTASQHNIFDLKVFLVLLTVFEPRSFGSRVRCCTNWATPSPRYDGRLMDALYAYAHFDDLDLDARLQWVSKGKTSALYVLRN